MTAKASAGKITVKWTASKGASSYFVQRRVKGESKWTTLKTGVKGISYVDTAVKAGVSYQYRVRGRRGKAYGAYKACSAVRAKEPRRKAQKGPHPAWCGPFCTAGAASLTVNKWNKIIYRWLLTIKRLCDMLGKTEGGMRHEKGTAGQQPEL